MNFVVYTRKNCPYCVKIKDVLRLTSQSFVEYTLEKDFTRQEFISEFGDGATFPQVLCDDKKLGGCSDTIKFLKEQNIINVQHK
jgi:glutaredoxin